MDTLIAISLLGVLTLFSGLLNLKKWILPLVITGIVIVLGINLFHIEGAKAWGGNMCYADKFSEVFNTLLILTTLVIFLISQQYYRKVNETLEGEYSIFLFSLAGAILMVAAANLATFFVGLEIMSISAYLLAGSHKHSFLSNEASMKYFLMGSFASAFLLMGIALLYGATGSLYYQDISAFINGHEQNLPMLAKAGIILIGIGMSFKVAAVPFHFWAPDVYHGSPTLVTAFMITTIKIAGFAAFLRLAMLCFGNNTDTWTISISIIAALSILVGNLGALTQTRIKRMMAYSSIAHTGYILLALISIQKSTPSIILYYAAAYALANLAFFIIIIVLKQSVGNSRLESFNGLVKSSPLLAVCGTIALLSLTGIPPLAGFMGKYLVFTSTLNAGYLWLIILALLGSVISIFYYFRPIINMFMLPEEECRNLHISGTLKVTLVVLTVMSVILGFIPGFFL